MAKTYNTISTFTSGQILTATQMNSIGTNVNNYRVPPMCMAVRTSDQTSYASDAAITWQSATYDTESPSDPMWASGSATRITAQTPGIYVITFTGAVTVTGTPTLVSPSIMINGNFSASFTAGISGSTNRWSISTIQVLADNDYVQASVGVSGGSAYIIEGNASQFNNDQTRLSVAWIGQAV